MDHSRPSQISAGFQAASRDHGNIGLTCAQFGSEGQTVREAAWAVSCFPHGDTCL